MLSTSIASQDGSKLDKSALSITETGSFKNTVVEQFKISWVYGWNITATIGQQGQKDKEIRVAVSNRSVVAAFPGVVLYLEVIISKPHTTTRVSIVQAQCENHMTRLESADLVIIHACQTPR